MCARRAYLHFLRTRNISFARSYHKIIVIWILLYWTGHGEPYSFCRYAICIYIFACTAALMTIMHMHTAQRSISLNRYNFTILQNIECMRFSPSPLTLCQQQQTDSQPEQPKRQLPLVSILNWLLNMCVCILWQRQFGRVQGKLCTTTTTNSKRKATTLRLRTLRALTNFQLKYYY